MNRDSRDRVVYRKWRPRNLGQVTVAPVNEVWEHIARNEVPDVETVSTFVRCNRQRKYVGIHLPLQSRRKRAGRTHDGKTLDGIGGVSRKVIAVCRVHE